MVGHEPEKALREHQRDMTQPQKQQQQQHQTPATSILRTVTSLFSAPAAEGDATELEEISAPAGKTPQAHSDDESLQPGQATPDSYPRGDGELNTGSTTPNHRDSSEAGGAPSSASSAPSVGEGARSTRPSGWWTANISVVAPSKAARDHLALERTYLSYHRTSLVLAILATVVAQLTIINHAPTPSPSFGFYVLGKPLAAALAGCALATSIIGGFRWWRLQRGLLRGVAVSGGGEVLVVAGGVAVIVIVMFALVIAVDVDKEY